MPQNKELEIARFIVEKTNKNLFLTGKAGTGKTTFLKDVKKYTAKKHIVLAPTGVAAVNAGAMTIHSFFQFGFGPYVKGVSEPEGNYMMKKEKLELIRQLELVIIDEISMVRADLLDHINDELQRIRHNSEPFGGVQMLLIGDLQQLPPVVSEDESEILQPYYSSMYFFESRSLRNSDYYCIELKKVFRQTDQSFIDILNRARVGALKNSDLNKLNSRFDPDFRPNNGENYINLVTHNRMADSINQKEMDSISDNPFNYEATVTGTFPEDSFPTNKQLVLKKGAQVMFVRNDPDKAFINGTLGEVVAIEDNFIQVKLSDSEKVIDVVPVVWENIRYHFNREANIIESQKIGSFTQYPLKLAWAITIHKSQGLTFEKAVIDAHAAFSPGQTYVALSRCRSLAGIVLSKRLSPRAFLTDSIVDEYMSGAFQDVDALAGNVGFVPFDYDRTVEQPGANVGKAAAINDEQNAAVYDALKQWRLQTAREEGIPAYVVIGNRTLAELSNALPEHISELNAIYGLGPQRIDRYGKAILEVIRQNRGQAIGLAPEPEKPTKEPKKKTWLVTYEMFQDGKTIPQIAQERCLTENTIQGHLCRYVESGELDVHRIVSDDVFEKVYDYITIRQNEVGLREIFDFFDGQISFGDIRLVLSYCKRNQQ